MGDDGAGFCQNGQSTVCKSLFIDLPAGRSDDQLYKGGHLPAFQDLGGSLQVFKASVCAGTDEDLVNGCSGKLTDRTDIVHLGRAGKNRNQIFRPVAKGTDISGIRISCQRLFFFCQFYLAVFCRLLIGRKERTFGSGLNRHIGHGHAAGNGHAFHGVSAEFQSLIGGSVCPQIADQPEDHVFGCDIGRKLSFDDDPDGLGNLDPHGSGAQDTCHLCVTDSRRKCTHAAVSGSVAVCTKYDVSRFYIESLRHKLMADAVASMDVFHAVFFHEGVADTEVPGIVHLACRHQMVVDQNDFVRIPELLKAHLFEFFRHEGDKDVMDHYPVHGDGNDISWFYGLFGVAAYDFFNDGLSHGLSLQSVQTAHGLYQPAGLNDIHQVLGK